MPAHVWEIERYHSKLPSRRHVRTLFSVPITVRHLGRRGVLSSKGISLNLCEGGLGAIVLGEVHVGDTVAIDLQLSGRSLTTVAIVRHTSSVHSGFEFVGLTQEEREQITNVIGHPNGELPAVSPSLKKDRPHGP